jgi:type I restriction enzyme, S subunit
VSANGKRPAGGATRLIRDLDHLTDSFAGVSALRRAIFEIAVAGELTAGTPQPAWRRVPLADFGEFSGGSTPSKARGAFWGGDVPWISPKDMKTPEIGDTEDKVTRLALSEGRLRLLPTGSVVLVVRSGILRRTVPVAVTTVSATLNQDMKGLIPRADIDPRFVRLLFRGCERTILETYVKGGTTVQSIKWDQLLTLELPLPPLAEQKRIVAKVDQLMALCDDLEAKQTKKRNLATQSTRSTLTALTTAESPADLAAAWKRISKEFQVICGRLGAVDELRGAVRDLAVRGVLTGTESTRGSALAALPGASRPSVEVAVPEDCNGLGPRELFPCPVGWTWTTVRAVCRDSFYGPRFAKEDYVAKDGVPTIRTTDMTDGGEIALRDPPCVRVAPEKLRLYRLEVNDLLVTRTGSIGTMAIFTGNYVALPSAYLIRFRFSESVYVRYILTYLQSPLGQALMGLGTTRVAQPNLNAESIKDIPLPLPPSLGEQGRIVAKVDHLMSILDDLEAKLRKQEETATRLAESLAAAVAA